MELKTDRHEIKNRLAWKRGRMTAERMVYAESGFFACL